MITSGNPTIGDVDELARLQLAASRLGLVLRIVEIDPRLQQLLGLAGLDEPGGPFCAATD